MSLITKRFHIGGMSCISCQNRIRKALKATPGIEEAEISYPSGAAKITFDPDVASLDQIERTIRELGYELLPEGKSNFTRSVCLSAIIVALYVLLDQLGLMNLLVPNRLAESGMSCGMLFVIGLLTSVHCIAMCGGVSLSQCLPGAEPQRNPFLPSLLYNAGRVVSYTVVGFLLGLLGMLAGNAAFLGMPALLQGIFKLAAGLMMTIMGVNMLGIFPWLRGFSLRLPRFLTMRIGAQKISARRPFIIGLFNGLMPCGPLQSMQLIALASGSPVSGALSMLLFSLGTVPLMLGLGAIVSALGRRFSRIITNAGAVLVSALGLAMLAQGGSLSGMLLPDRLTPIIIGLFAIGLAASLPLPKRLYRLLSAATAAALILIASFLWQPAAKPSAASSVQILDGVQQVNSILLPGQYPTIMVQADMPVVWNISAPEGSINGCNYRLFIPEYNVDLTFSEGDNIIEFTPEKTGEFAYFCWMGMIRGSIIVT